MQKFTTLRTALLKVGAWSVITVVGGNIGALSTASAQSDPVLTTVSAVEEQAPAAEPRATKEPVFRVSKLNREKAPTESLQGSASDRKVQVPAQTAELASSSSAAETTPFRTASSATFPVPQPLVNPRQRQHRNRLLRNLFRRLRIRWIARSISQKAHLKTFALTFVTIRRSWLSASALMECLVARSTCR
jgi:hypothetical protein